MTRLADYVTYRELLANLTLRELRAKYKRSLLGWSWSLLNPLATMLIYTLVFRFFLRIDVPTGSPSGLTSFPLFLLCGLLAWNFVINGINGSITTLLVNANLIKKTYFPRELLVASQVASWLVSLLVEVLLLCVAFLVVGNMVLPYLPVAALLLVVLALFVTGLALGLSALNVYFRDVQHLAGIVFQVWFYLTPILYPITLVPERAPVAGADLPLRAIYSLNPLVGFVEAIRDCLYELRLPSPSNVAGLVVVSVATFLAGLYVFSRLDANLVEEL